MKFKLRSKTSEEIVDELAAGGKNRAAPKKGKFLKQIKLSKKPQFVLSLGDEGAILTCFKGAATQGRWFAPAASPENLEVFGKAIAAFPGAPIIIVFDTIDQHYSQQTLPPVSKMSVSGLLKRRASREFGRAMELQGNYLLNRSESKEWNYMLFAVEANERTQAWIDWLYTQPCRPKGIRVLPLEMGALINALAEKDAIEQPKLYQEQRGWKYLLSYNKVSGVRQVIMRDGKMLFTRLGQPLEGDAHTEAGALEQEIISTVEYLKRIGLKTIHDLHLYIIAGQEVIEVMDRGRMGVEANTLMSPFKAAQMINLNDVVQPEDRFGDVMIAGFVASYTKSKYVLWTKPMSKIHALYMAIPSIRVMGALVVLGTIGASGSAVYDYLNYGSVIEDNNRKKSQFEQKVTELKSQSNMPVNELEKILELYDIYKPLYESQLNPNEFFINISWMMAGLSKHMRIQQIGWSMGSEDADGQAVAATPGNSMTGMDMGGMDPGAPQQDNGAPPSEAELPKKDPPPNSVASPVVGGLNINILVPGNIKDAELQIKVKEIMDRVRPYFPYYALTLEPVRGARKASDSMSIDFSEPQTEDKQLRRVTLIITFKGSDYIHGLTSGGGS